MPLRILRGGGREPDDAGEEGEAEIKAPGCSSSQRTPRLTVGMGTD